MAWGSGTDRPLCVSRGFSGKRRKLDRAMKNAWPSLATPLDGAFDEPKPKSTEYGVTVHRQRENGRLDRSERRGLTTRSALAL